MAVYKSTRCYPFLNSVDIRTTQSFNSAELPVQYLKCKVETSNKKITGYKIRILDEANNQVFPLSGENYISPITELQKDNMGDIYETNGINSGLNGTYLYIPFFQNMQARKTKSFNALYYTPRYRVDHIILDNSLYSQFKGASATISGANNIRNWRYVTGSYNNIEYNWADATAEDITRNRIQLDGEDLLEGQTVLVTAEFAGDYVSRGIYEVVKTQTTVSGHILYQTELHRLTYATSEQILVTHGNTFHNTVWRRSTSADAYIKEDSNYFFVKFSQPNLAVENMAVPNIGVSNSLYKWEITLYQGEGVVHGVADDPVYITYDSLGNQDYDMTVTSGTVMGSTTSRIQIASENPFGVNKPVLPGLKEGVLVLQGKYMALGGTTDNGILSNNRFYVKSYDASYGHAYTLDGALDAGNIVNYTKVQFFKYSNDPDSILETDKVLYGCGYNISFKYCDKSNPQATIHDLDEFSLVGVNNRIYGIYQDELPTGLLNLIKDGDKILLTGEDGSTAVSQSFQNGVYQVYTPGTTTELPTGILWLKRAAGYDSWSKFLGKVVYCPTYYPAIDTVSQSTNLESLAGSGSYTLWDPDQGGAAQTKGGAALFFANERPILLFGQQFNNDYTYDLKYDGVIPNNQPVASAAGLDVIDGMTVQEGFTVVHRMYAAINYAAISKVQKINNELYFVRQNILLGNNLYYITQGKNYGKAMYRNTSTIPDWSLYTATVLHNTTEYTFITPFLNVETTMRLKFMQNKKAVLSNNTNTSWLDIIDADKTLYCIKHSTLYQALVSEISIESNTPYKYEIKSYFKASDENPFYICEAPYLILYKNNQEYTTLSNLSLYQEYWTTVETQILQQFNVTPESGDIQAYLFRSYADGAAILDRAVKFSAKYIQFDGVSWESYRWALFNAQGELLQDSGVKYDKTIAAVFYGLSNDSSQGVNYYVALEVEDEKKNRLVYLIKTTVRAGRASESVSNFTAKFDCDNHAVRLDYIPYGTNSGNNKATIYRREYEVYERPGEKIYGHISEVEGVLVFVDLEGNTPVYTTNVIYVDVDSNHYYGYNDVYRKLEMIDAVRVYKGEWELVVLKTNLKTLYDYNITSGKKYQYLLYPNDTMSFDIDESIYLANSSEQIFANSDKSYRVWAEDAIYPNQGVLTDGTPALSTSTGAPVVTSWDEWSICELVPEEVVEDTPSVKKIYKVNKEQVWLFKYSLETGGQTQNIARKDIQTLGTYAKISFGEMNYASGEVTALLGSELVPGTDLKYIERLKKSRLEALSTNEKIKMLETWRNFIYSKNPKLLKDIKGQSWIVQIIGGSNTPKNFYAEQPDTITFQWKQVDDVKNTIIYSDAGQLQAESQAYGSITWEPMFKFGSTSNNTFMIMWQDWDNSVIQQLTLAYGAIPVEPEAPTREATARYTYTFDKWEPALTRVTENKIYTATYTKTIRQYTITWEWEAGDGTIHTTTEQYNYGEYPVYKQAEPQKEGYTFMGWSPNVHTVDGDITYTAEFDEMVEYTLAFYSLNGGWYEDLKEVGGEEMAPVTEPIEHISKYTNIYYSDDVDGYPGFLLPYEHEDYGQIMRKIYFVPAENTGLFTYDSGHVTGPDWFEGEETTQYVNGWADREGNYELTVQLTSGTDTPPEPESGSENEGSASDNEALASEAADVSNLTIPETVIGGHWELAGDPAHTEVTQIEARNGDTVFFYYNTGHVPCVLITHGHIDPNYPPVSPFVESMDGIHLTWVTDLDYSFNSMCLLYHEYTPYGEVLTPAVRHGDVLGEIEVSEENQIDNIIYVYLGQE